MNDEPDKTPIPRHVHRDIRSGTDPEWSPPPLPHWPDQRKRYALYAKIEQARRKAVSDEIIYLLDEFVRLLQCVSLAARQVIERPEDADKDTVPEIDPNVPEIISGTADVPRKGRGRPALGRSEAERKRDYRRRQAEKIIKG